MDIVLDGRKLELKKVSTIAGALKQAGINPETVLVKRDGELVPQDALVKDGDSMETIKVVSGG
jgi:thiamine biosynthesis protein ThiS